MSTVKEILEIKGHEVCSIGVSQSVYQAIEMMAEMEVGALTVLDDDANLVGMISERDYARKVILKNKSSRETSVAEVMTREVVFVGKETPIDKCMSLMSQNKIRHLPVMDSETLLGIITIADLLTFINKEQMMTIEELESYIMEDRGGSG